MPQNKWSPGRRINQQYRRDIIRLLYRFFEVPEGEYTALIDKLQAAGPSEFLDRYAQAVSQRMITGLLVENARNWREAARQSMQGPYIYQALQQEMQGAVGVRVRDLIDANARLISRIPLDVAERVSGFVMREQQKGARSEAIAERLREMVPEMAQSRIDLIARTETSKASTALTRARSEELDLNWYIWCTSEDQRVRASHRKMDGVIISWDDPASPERLANERSSLGAYDPGDAPNCRCYPEPLLRLDQVRWPHKVYHAGRIQMMTRAKFEALQGVGVAA